MSRSLEAQQPIPVRTLAPSDAASTRPFGTKLGIHARSTGSVLVNDGSNRQLVLLDSTFRIATVVLDSVSGPFGGAFYGPEPSPLMPYLGDSSLFVDRPSLTLLLIDPAGKIARSVAPPKTSDLRSLIMRRAFVDPQGNLVYRAEHPRRPPSMNDVPWAGMLPFWQPPDTSPLVRASFETRRLDTLVYFITGPVQRLDTVRVGERMTFRLWVDPLVTVDDWALLADGTVAIVRGHDYHVDFLPLSGPRRSSPKLPFVWLRLTDEDREFLVDSVRRAKEASPVSSASSTSAAPAVNGASIGPSRPPRQGPNSPVPASFCRGTNTHCAYPRPDELRTYWPSFRAGTTWADLEGNLWILPTTSAQSKQGELVYDVVNSKGALVERVRMPLGRSITGFGPGGAIYLMHRTDSSGWQLERTRKQ